MERGKGGGYMCNLKGRIKVREENICVISRRWMKVREEDIYATLRSWIRVRKDVYAILSQEGQARLG